MVPVFKELAVSKRDLCMWPWKISKLRPLVGQVLASEEGMVSFAGPGTGKDSEERLLRWILKEEELTRGKAGRPFQTEAQRHETEWLVQGTGTTPNNRNKGCIWDSSNRYTYGLWEYSRMVGERQWGPEAFYQVLAMGMERKGRSASFTRWVTLGKWINLSESQYWVC